MPNSETIQRHLGKNNIVPYNFKCVYIEPSTTGAIELQLLNTIALVTSSASLSRFGPLMRHSCFVTIMTPDARPGKRFIVKASALLPGGAGSSKGEHFATSHISAKSEHFAK